MSRAGRSGKRPLRVGAGPSASPFQGRRAISAPKNMPTMERSRRTARIPDHHGGDRLDISQAAHVEGRAKRPRRSARSSLPGQRWRGAARPAHETWIGAAGAPRALPHVRVVAHGIHVAGREWRVWRSAWDNFRHHVAISGNGAHGDLGAAGLDRRSPRVAEQGHRRRCRTTGPSQPASERMRSVAEKMPAGQMILPCAHAAASKGRQLHPRDQPAVNDRSPCRVAESQSQRIEDRRRDASSGT